MIRPDELVVDCFAGGGGASTGIETALGRPIDIAINHDPQAIAMHVANHPETRPTAKTSHFVAHYFPLKLGSAICLTLSHPASKWLAISESLACRCVAIWWIRLRARFNLWFSMVSRSIASPMSEIRSAAKCNDGFGCSLRYLIIFASC